MRMASDGVISWVIYFRPWKQQHFYNFPAGAKALDVRDCFYLTRRYYSTRFPTILRTGYGRFGRRVREGLSLRIDERVPN